LTNTKRRAIAQEFRKLLDKGILRKAAITRIRKRHGVSRTSLYVYCGRFNISTN